MKKVLLSLSFLIAGAMIFYACKKEQIEVPVSSTSGEYSIINGRLAFKSVESYETFVEESESPSNAKLNLNKKGSSDTLIEDDFLASILNEKNIIQIGNNAYKLDFAEYKVYVLREVNDENIVLLENKNVSSGKLVVYSMDDDVLEEEEVEEGEEEVNESIAFKKKKRKRCREDGVKRCKDSRTLNTKDEISITVNADGSITTTYALSQFFGKLVYQKAGIYFSIQSKLVYDASTQKVTLYSNGKTSTSTTYNNNQLFYGSALASGMYKVKCKDEHSFNITVPANCYNKIKLDDSETVSRRIYRGSKALNKYCAQAHYKFNTNGCVTAINAEMILKIGQGYAGCVACP
jgi:hypothetical protein